MRESFNRRQKKRQCLRTFMLDFSLVLVLISILAVTYYPVERARWIRKLACTCNVLVLLFVIRMRIFKCVGYPLQYMQKMRICCPFTRIRMRLADYFCFFYIFLAEVVNCSILALKQYVGEEEMNCSISMAVLNAIYILFWIMCTNYKSYHNFPKEMRRQRNAQQNGDNHANQEGQEGDREQGRAHLTKEQCQKRVKSMQIFEETKDMENQQLVFDEVGNAESISKLCAICLEKISKPSGLGQQVTENNVDVIPSNELNQNLIQDKQQGTSKKGILKKVMNKLSPSKKHKTSQVKEIIRTFPECEHLFHEKCLIQWFEISQSCPLCRRIPAIPENLTDSSMDDDIDNLFCKMSSTPDSRVVETQDTLVRSYNESDLRPSSV